MKATAKYVVKPLSEVKDDEECGVDESYTLGELCSLIVADHLEVIRLDDVVWFGNRADYMYAPKSAVALVKVKRA